MNVPITSDIIGYEQFWSRWLTIAIRWVIIVVLVLGAIVVELAILIWEEWR